MKCATMVVNNEIWMSYNVNYMEVKSKYMQMAYIKVKIYNSHIGGNKCWLPMTIVKWDTIRV